MTDRSVKTKLFLQDMEDSLDDPRQSVSDHLTDPLRLSPGHRSVSCLIDWSV